MAGVLYLIFIVIAIIRIYLVFYSKRNEKRLVNDSGMEYDQKISAWLAILHTVFYFSAFFEGMIRKTQFDFLSYIGLFLLIFSFIAIAYVIRVLGNYWTVKLIFMPDHQLNTHFLFKIFKHPNYYLNIIPELIAVTLLFHAWISAIIFLIPYSYCLYRRIKKENALLKMIA